MIAIAVLLAAGWVRMPFEQRLTEGFRREGLLSEPLEIGLRERIGQNSSVVALAGLRSLVATFAHLRATESFSKQEWGKVGDSMETAVQLAPRDIFYWDMGSWHMAYNASSSALSDGDVSPLLAKAESKRWVVKGREFLERGIRNNPDDWRLYATLGRLLSDANRMPDPAAAEEAYAKAIVLGNAPPSLERRRLYAEASAGKDPARTLENVRRILMEPGSRTPTMLSILYSLEYQNSPPDDPLDLALAVFGTEEKALRNLGDYYVDVRESYPITGVAAGIRRLEGRKGISPDDEASYIWQRKHYLEFLGLSR